MDIKTKFDIGDTPLFLHNNKPVKLKITEIQIICNHGKPDKDDPYIMYTGDFKNNYGMSTTIVSEKYVYSSIEEMKEQLFKDVKL